jgi:hypothetical protein
MNDLRDRLQELADGYARVVVPPGPAAARRRGRDRRRRTAAAVVLAGVLVVALAAGLRPVLTAPRSPGPIGPPPPAPLQPPRSTAWFRPTHVPDGYRRSVDMEWPFERLGPPLPTAQSFRRKGGNGEVTVSVNPELQRLDVTRELRTYPKVRAVRVRGRPGLLFPHRQDNFSSGLTWEERPGLVVQVVGGEGVSDRLLGDVAEGLEIGAGSPATITVGPLPEGWIRVPDAELPTAAGNLVVLPRRHHYVYSTGVDGGPLFAVLETRDRHGPAQAADPGQQVPNGRRERVTVHGRPATLVSAPGRIPEPAMFEFVLVWREPGGVELQVLADWSVGRAQVLAIAEGLRQP